MNKGNNSENQNNNTPFLYSLTVLGITWLIAIGLFINPSVGLKAFNAVMFIPALVAILFKKIKPSETYLPKRKINIKSLSFGILYPLLFIFLSAMISVFSGYGTFNTAKLPDVNIVFTIIVTILINLFTVLGEEYGWRGYLLPRLTRQYGKTKATSILGIIWALYHAPIVFFLAKATGISHPLLLSLIQATVVFTITFPFSYCYYLSGSILPVLFFHSIWNVINTTVLGDIYSNKQGIIEGNLVIINGEGLLGLILGILFISWFIRQFQKNDKSLMFSTGFFKKIS